MDNNKLISIVIPTRNRPKYLEKAIQTVLKQTYQDFEIIIIDDGSETDYNPILKKHKDKRIKYYKNPNKKGAPFSRNLGTEKAKGEYIAFLDDDDEWDPTKLEKQIKEIKNPKVGLVICYSLDKRFGRQRISKPPKTVTYKNLLRSFNLSSTSSYMTKKKIIKEIGGFDLSLPSAQEYDLAIRISKKYQIITIPEILMTQNASEGQISENWTKKIKGIIAMYKKYAKEYPVLGFKKCLKNHFKNLGLILMFSLGFIFGNKIYSLLTPMKERYEIT